MKERVKTISLAVLVGISIFLAKQLWIELPDNVLGKAYEDKSDTSSYLLVDMIAPSKYLINFDENNHTLFYDESKHSLWTSARESLRDVFLSKDLQIVEVSKEEYSNYNKKRSISFSFPEHLNTYILAKALDVRSPNEIVDLIQEVNQIYIYLGSGEPFFVFSNGEKNLKLLDKSLKEASKITRFEEGDGLVVFNKSQVKNLDSNRFEELKLYIDRIEEEGRFNYYFSMRDTLGADRDIFVPYEMNNILPRVFVENKINILSDNEKIELAENFFGKDIDYIREVVENNGSDIYIYDQKVLKLNVNGSLEYFNALDEDIKNRNLYDSMVTASKFLAETMGVPEGLYLAYVDDVEDKGSLGYKFTFKYRVRGIPVIVGNKEAIEFVEMEVYNDHVKSYKQFMRQDMKLPLDFHKEERKMLSSFDVIDMNYEIFLQAYLDEHKDAVLEEITTEDILSTIKDVNLAYYDPCFKDKDEELIGIWAIRTKTEIYGFDVYEGRLIY